MPAVLEESCCCTGKTSGRPPQFAAGSFRLACCRSVAEMGAAVAGADVRRLGLLIGPRTRRSRTLGNAIGAEDVAQGGDDAPVRERPPTSSAAPCRCRTASDGQSGRKWSHAAAAAARLRSKLGRAGVSYGGRRFIFVSKGRTSDDVGDLPDRAIPLRVPASARRRT